jgi:hypothetical protein
MVVPRTSMERPAPGRRVARPPFPGASVQARRVGRMPAEQRLERVIFADPGQAALVERPVADGHALGRGRWCSASAVNASEGLDPEAGVADGHSSGCRW